MRTQLPLYGLMVYLLGVISTANGESPPSTPNSRTIEIVIVSKIIAYKAELLDDKNQPLIGKQGITITLNGTDKRSALVTGELPDEAQAIRFISTEDSLPGESKPFPFRFVAGSTVGIALDPQVQRKLGFDQALGGPIKLGVEFTTQIEVRPKAPKGLEGWIFVGNKKHDAWELHTVDGVESAKDAGQRQKIIFPVNVRDSVGSRNPRRDILSVGQEVQINHVQSGGGNVWAEITVVK